ncbi:hypothetical protein BV898_18162 [Hypsibius exemplaris]|uniref:SAP domain-containing protein n=1 Tax=Hypsibius exemplaris TaxID=2072580 RepID=A0A9X6NH41_HYPEX|nr:hypothetical protein BV898_18162 [Hypsibius exemplaris]
MNFFMRFKDGKERNPDTTISHVTFDTIRGKDKKKTAATLAKKEYYKRKYRAEVEDLGFDVSTLAKNKSTMERTKQRIQILDHESARIILLKLLKEHKDKLAKRTVDRPRRVKATVTAPRVSAPNKSCSTTCRASKKTMKTQTSISTSKGVCPTKAASVFASDIGKLKKQPISSHQGKNERKLNNISTTRLSFGSKSSQKSKVRTRANCSTAGTSIVSSVGKPGVFKKKEKATKPNGAKTVSPFAVSPGTMSPTEGGLSGVHASVANAASASGSGSSGIVNVLDGGAKSRMTGTPSAADVLRLCGGSTMLANDVPLSIFVRTMSGKRAILANTWSKLKVLQLRTELQNRKLSQSGPKRNLIFRLVDDIIPGSPEQLEESQTQNTADRTASRIFENMNKVKRSFPNDVKGFFTATCLMSGGLCRKVHNNVRSRPERRVRQKMKWHILQFHMDEIDDELEERVVSVEFQQQQILDDLDSLKEFKTHTSETLTGINERLNEMRADIRKMKMLDGPTLHAANIS